MSKKDRLKKQSERQLQAIREAERMEAAEYKRREESRSAKKMRKRAKRLDSAVTTVLKILMCLPFLWSGLYYGGIFVVGISMGQMDDVPGRIAAYIGIGSAVCLVGIVLAFLGKYIAQFIVILAGTICYMQGASYIIDKAKERIGEGYGLSDEQKALAVKWRWGLYPIMALAVLSGLLLAVYIIKYAVTKRRKQKELDNAPTKSIIEQ